MLGRYQGREGEWTLLKGFNRSTRIPSLISVQAGTRFRALVSISKYLIEKFKVEHKPPSCGHEDTQIVEVFLDTDDIEEVGALERQGLPLCGGKKQPPYAGTCAWGE